MKRTYSKPVANPVDVKLQSVTAVVPASLIFK